jgi:hypothetical protein
MRGDKAGGSRLHREGVCQPENTQAFEKRTNLEDFKKDALRRNVFEYYDKGEFPTVKKSNTLKWKKWRTTVQFTFHSL